MAVRHIARPDLNPADARAARLLDQIAREFQLVPPMTLHLADPDLLAGFWHAVREAYVVHPAKRGRREAVAATVSELNACPYCVTVHAAMFASAGGDVTGLQDLTRLDPDTRAACGWARASLSPDSPALLNHRIPAADVPQVFGTAILFHYVNRPVSVFLGETPMALPGMASAPGERLARSLLGLFATRIVNLDPVPGQAVDRIPAELPAAFAWAEADPTVAAGFAQFAAAAEAAGRAALSDPVRELVIDHLAGWRGEAPPLSRAWLEDAVSPLIEADRPAARLALMTARAAWAVDDGLIDAFRAAHQGDTVLVQAVAWAGFAAARRIAGWFPVPVNPVEEPERS